MTPSIVWYRIVYYSKGQYNRLDLMGAPCLGDPKTLQLPLRTVRAYVGAIGAIGADWGVRVWGVPCGSTS